MAHSQDWWCELPHLSNKPLAVAASTVMAGTRIPAEDIVASSMMQHHKCPQLRPCITRPWRCNDTCSQCSY